MPHSNSIEPKNTPHENHLEGFKLAVVLIDILPQLKRVDIVEVPQWVTPFNKRLDQLHPVIADLTPIILEDGQ